MFNKTLAVERQRTGIGFAFIFTADVLVVTPLGSPPFAPIIETGVHPRLFAMQRDISLILAVKHPEKKGGCRRKKKKKKDMGEASDPLSHRTRRSIAWTGLGSWL